MATTTSFIQRLAGFHMAEVWVTCINKSPHNNTHEGITHLGGKKWKWTQQQAIASIEARQHTFCVSAGGRRTEVRIVEGPHGKFLRTIEDGHYNDNLLALGECP
jgi:hypothetical protein